jgi:tetratricopeptide (TPR) repeat protein
MAALLARAVREQGRGAEALALTELAERSAADDDIDAQVLWRAARAPILARAGAIEEAETMARAALDMARQTELTDLLASTLVEFATVLRLAGQAEAARSALDEAIGLYAAKGDLASERRARAMSAGL